MNSPAAGTLKIVGGATIAIAGTWDPTDGKISVSGGGYTINATYANGELIGTYTGPTTSGNASAFPAGVSGTVQAYCGTFEEPGKSGGVLIFVRNGSSILASSSSGDVTVFRGTISGSTVTFSLPVTTVTGTVSGNSMSGTWSDPEGSGTWSVSTDAC